MNYLTYFCFHFCIQTGTDPKKELDKAQFNRMQDLLKRKRQAQKDGDVSILLAFKLSCNTNTSYQYKWRWIFTHFCFSITLHRT